MHEIMKKMIYTRDNEKKLLFSKNEKVLEKI